MDPSVLRGGPSPHAQDGARGILVPPTSLEISQTARGAADLPAIRGAPARTLPPSRDGNASGLGAHRCRIITRRLDTGPRLMAASP
jgi:hypothetical protein